MEFVRAGGDMVLTVDAGQAATMTGGAAWSAATADPSFRALVDAAALRVLQAKQAPPCSESRMLSPAAG